MSIGLTLGDYASAGAGGGGDSSAWATWNGSTDGSSVATSGSPENGAMTITNLSATSVLGFWADSITTFGWAAVGTITNGVIAWGTPALVSGSTSLSVNGANQMVALSSTQALVTCVSGGGGVFSAFVINISGTVPSGGTFVTIDSAGADKFAIDKTSSTQAIVTWCGGTSKFQLVALTVSGSTVTVGTAISITASLATFPLSISNISSTAALLLYADSSNSSFITARIISISGTTLSTNTAYVIDGATSVSNASACCYLAQLSPTSFAASYAASGVTYGIALSVSGTVISEGSKVTIQSNNIDYRLNTLCLADSNHVMFGYLDSANAGAGVFGNLWGIVGHVVGTTLTLETAVQIAPNPIQRPLMCNLDTTDIISVYQSQNYTIYGQVVSTNTPASVAQAWSAWNGTYDGNTLSSTAAPQNTCACSLTAGTTLVFYSDSATGYGFAVIGTINSNTITWGTPVNVTGTTYYVKQGLCITTVNEAQAVVAFEDANSGFLYSMIINVSGTTPSGGTPKQVGTNSNTNVTSVSIATTNTSDAILSYVGPSTGLNAVNLSIGTSTITLGTILQVNASTTSGACAISTVTPNNAVQALLFYIDGNNANKPTAMVLTISGTTLSTNTAYVIASTTGTTVCEIAQLNNSLYGVSFSDTSNTYAAALSLSGTVVTAGTPVTVNTVSHTSAKNAMCVADSSNLMFMYVDSSNILQGRTGTVSGTTITLNTVKQVAAATVQNPSICQIDTHHILTTYNNATPNLFGLVTSTV